MDFFNVYAQGFARVAAANAPIVAFDPRTNAERTAELVRQADERGVAVVAFPELGISGASIEDLMLDASLLDAVGDAVLHLARDTSQYRPLFAVGAPLRMGNRVANCAVVIHRGAICGIVPKQVLGGDEARYFTAPTLDLPDTIVIPGLGDAPLAVGSHLSFAAEDVPGLVVHVQLGGDLSQPASAPDHAALHGATVLLTLAATPATIGRAAERREWAASLTRRCLAAHVYAAAGFGESSNDAAWDGQLLIHDQGELLAEGRRFSRDSQLVIADIDVDRARQDRAHAAGFDLNLRSDLGGWTLTPVAFTVAPPTGDLGLERPVERFPFVPTSPQRLDEDCSEAYHIQVSALQRRMLAIGGGDPQRAPKLCIGVSGGLDSTHALIVAAKACDQLGLPRTHILAWTMPGFATTEHTRTNAQVLSEALGVTFETVDIRPMATQMLSDLRHPHAEGRELYDVTFENVQAGLRYDFLFRAANRHGGIVVGTGDLSELALGWCTYGVGDHISHYGLNAGVPKTLMQHLIRWVARSEQFSDEVNEVLNSVLDTEISPELIPTQEGAVAQSTEASIGPYELQDFNLHYLVRHGMRPRRIAFLAHHAWGDASRGRWPVGYPVDKRRSYDLATIHSWLRVFLQRFATNQFKRSTLPNGPEVVAVSLSPRGGWRMPSDVGARVWLAELDRDLPR